MRRAALYLLFCCVTLWSQTDRAVLTGTVSDPARATVPNANVLVRAEATGAEHPVKTNSDGSYTINALPIGRYSAVFSAPGFRDVQVEPFTLDVGQTRTLNAVMTVASQESRIVVEAGVDLNQSNAQIGDVITGSQTQELPLNGRYWASLMALIPGAIDSGSGGQSTIRFAGLSQEDNNFRFDGVDATGINHQFQKEPIRLQIPTESIAEFRASSAVYTADQGGSPGGQVDVVSRSGGNQYHGSVYEFFRNSVFDARTYNAATVAPFRLNNYGGSLGGPIYRNKVFFFANYEGYRQVFYQQSSGNVPTAAYRAAVIAKSPALAPLVNAFPIGTIATRDPNALLWIGTGRSPTNEDAGLIRVDWNISDKTIFSGRFNDDHYIANTPVGLGEQQSTTLDTPNAVVDLQHTFTPTTLNDVRFGFNRAAYHNGGATRIPYTLTITGFDTYALPDPSLRHDNSFSFLDTANFVRGRHALKAGVEVKRYQENKSSPDIPRETLSYLSEANFMNNILDSDSYGSAAPRTGARKTYYAGYVLDEYKLRRNLTFNVGLRYEYFGVDHEVNGRGLVFDPKTCGAVAYCPAGSAWYFPNTLDFSPRVSIAWSPEALHGKTVIRTGFGIFRGDGQFGALAAFGGLTYSYNLTQKNIPGLSYPLTPFLGNMATSSGITAKDRNRKDVERDEWSFLIQHEVARETNVTLAYYGAKGTHLFTSDTLNGINPATGLRPYASLTNSTIGYTTSNAVSNFNALQVNLKRNLTRGLLLSASYQWSHAIDDGSNGGGEADGPENVACRSCERASSDFDVRHNLSASGIWQLPIGRGHALLGSAPGLLTTVLGGWQLSGIGHVRSGVPLNVTLSRNANSLPNGISANQRPDLVPGQPLYPANQNVNNWLNPYAFTTPANGAWGNAGRNVVRAPGVGQIEASLEKRFLLTERVGLSFRADVFNLTNRAQIGSPNVKWTDPAKGTTFGAITSAYTATPVGHGNAAANPAYVTA